MMQSAPIWEKGRYIDFFGAPIGPDGKSASDAEGILTEKNLNGVAMPGVMTAMIHLGLLFLKGKPLSYIQNEEMISGVPVLFAGGVLAFWRRKLEEGFLKEIFYESVHSQCIDTAPGENVRSADLARQQASIAARIYDIELRSCRLYFATAAVAAAVDLNIMSSMMFVAGATRAISGVSGRRRFEKVAQGEWVIVERPQPLEEKELVMLPSAG